MADADRAGLREAGLSTPIRTCIGCRVTDSRSVLLRVVAGVAHEGVTPLVPDPRRHLPGRGCWLHPTRDCFDLALRRRAFVRALRIEGATEPSVVLAWVESHLAGVSHPTAVPNEILKAGFRNEPPMSTQQ